MAPTPGLVCVIGAGTMGQGIAQVALSAGHEVALVDLDLDHDLLRTARDRIHHRLSRRDTAVADTTITRLTTAASVADVPYPERCVIAIEAVVENLAVKHAVLSAASDRFGEHAILATNTSSLSITEIAAGVPAPPRVVGMHFFNPVPVMRLVEVVAGLETRPDLLDQVTDLAESWGKVPTRVRSTPGFIVNRVARPFYGESLRLLEEGAATLEVIDTTLRSAGGFRMGPFELMDLVGNDVNETVTRTVWSAFHHDARFTPSRLQRELVAAGRFGRKTGRVSIPTTAARTGRYRRHNSRPSQRRVSSSSTEMHRNSLRSPRGRVSPHFTVTRPHRPPWNCPAAAPSGSPAVGLRPRKQPDRTDRW
jgi:3-hydroxybutyryl-CoA dehydrogenase